MKGYKQRLYKGKIVREHRLIMAKHLNKSLDELGYIDHIDGNIHNNDLSNLREVLPQQNSFNTKLSKSNKVGLKGISFDKSRGKWRVSIKAGKLYQKRFNNLFDAACYAITKRKELHNEYAKF